MPFAGKFRFEEFDENADFAFGYELFRRLGNELQEGRREYVYRNGNLIYSGTPLYEDYIITVQSPANKKIATLIPKNIDKYENALFHAQSNHYFMHDEPVTFKVTTHIRKDCELTKLNITLLDAFFDEIQSVEYSSTPTEKFYEYGFTTFEHNINLGEMAQEVYHIKAEILLGDVVVCKHISAFEVIDNSKLSPRQSSKIPFIYSGEATPPNIEFNCPDPWMIKPDHNEAHYIDCLLTVPEVAENRNGWDILKLYKKTMFTWINNRTIPHKKTYRDYPNCLKNSDYARIQPLEAVELVSYITNPSIFTKPTVLEIYQDFKNEHKDYVLPDISENGRISTEDFTEFYKTHGSEWIEYLCNPDKNIRTFWIRHMQAVREIAEYIGKELNQSCVCNYWVQDGMKDMPANRIKYRALMKDSFDEVFSKKKISPQYVYDALEPKLFAVGVEEYTVGSNDFYLSYHGYARSKGIGNTIMNLDLGHFHCEENVADKISSVMLFSDKFMAHFTRGLRWDSDHVVINDDKTNNMMREIVRCGVLDNTFIGTDYFDASVNRVAAWTIGTRATKKALLSAMLEPVHLLQKAEDEQDFTLRLALMDEFKSLPSSAVWDYYCVKSNIPANTEWLNDLKTYEKDVMFKR